MFNERPDEVAVLLADEVQSIAGINDSSSYAFQRFLGRHVIVILQMFPGQNVIRKKCGSLHLNSKCEKQVMQT